MRCPLPRVSRRQPAVAGAVAIAVIAMVLAMLPAPSASGALRSGTARSLQRAPAPGRRPAVRTVSLSVDPGAAIGPVVPSDFLGLSFEAGSLPRIAAYAASGDLVNLLRSLGQGIIRFGGISADLNTAWSQPGLPLPAWAGAWIVPQDLTALAELAQATGWRVLLTVNLGRYDPAAAAQEAQAARSLLGASLAGIEIGNEPDRYVADRLRRAGWTFAAYRRQVDAYRAAIAGAAPGVQIVGPDASSGRGGLPWVTSEATAERPVLLTDHYYPLSKCSHRSKLGDLLSPSRRTSQTAMLARLAAIARASALPLRLDETNNISCRGQPGVSNAFASALWAVDYAARAMASGMSGLNFHDLITAPRAYSPLVAAGPRELASGALRANPEWYALLLAGHLLGDRPVHTSVTAGNPELSASAFVGADERLHIALVNFAPPRAKRLVVHLRLPLRLGAGPILRLTAPAPSATAGVALGGRGVSGAGTWSPATTLPSVYGKPGSLVLVMPPSSAALVTLYPITGVLTPHVPATARAGPHRAAERGCAQAASTAGAATRAPACAGGR
jgi:hypothetical protein